MATWEKQFEVLSNILTDKGIGGFWGSGIRIKDRDFANASLEDADQRVGMAMQKLSDEGLVPQDDYAANGADCDNWAGWIWAEVSKQWAKEHEGQESYPAYPLGSAWQPGHEFNCGVFDGQVHTWNYGQRVEWDLNKIKEVEFK